MSVISRLHRVAEQATAKAQYLRFRGGARRLEKARRLEEKAAFNREVLASWDDERWG